MMTLVPTHPHLKGFRSASEETAGKGAERWENEGGHLSYSRARVVHTPGSSYKAMLKHHRGHATEHAFATMREAEAFIRRNTPVPLPRSTLFDRVAGDAGVGAIQR